MWGNPSCILGFAGTFPEEDARRGRALVRVGLQPLQLLAACVQFPVQRIDAQLALPALTAEILFRYAFQFFSLAIQTCLPVLFQPFLLALRALSFPG